MSEPEDERETRDELRANAVILLLERLLTEERATTAEYREDTRFAMSSRDKWVERYWAMASERDRYRDKYETLLLQNQSLKDEVDGL